MCTIAYAVVYCGSSNNLYMVHLHQCGHTMIQNSPFSPKKDGTPNRCGCSVEAQRRHKIRARHFPELERKNPWINHQHQLSCNYFYGPLTALRERINCSGGIYTSDLPPMNSLSFSYGVRGRCWREALDSSGALSSWAQLQCFSCCWPRHAVAANHLSRPSDTNTTHWTTGLDCYVNNPVMLILWDKAPPPPDQRHTPLLVLITMSGFGVNEAPVFLGRFWCLVVVYGFHFEF